MRQHDDVLIEDYRTPPGHYDLPYIYNYNGDALTDGLSYQNIRVLVGDGADFLMRRFSGLQTLAARVQIRDDYAPFFATQNGVVTPRDWPVLPEKHYAVGSDVNFDLFTVLRATNVGGGDTIFYPQLIWQGVRRFPQIVPPKQDRYYTKVWTYDIDLNMTWAGTDVQPRRFYISIFDHDFELHKITAYRYSRLGAASFAVPFAEFRILLFDSSPRQLMSSHINDFFVFDNADGGGSMQYNSVFPVPAVVYPVGGVITFEIVGLLPNNLVPSRYQICFHGVKRVPC